ncbi:RNA polymerase sigma factor, sigma-70 family [Filimonas lacunae]|uniref:RNA polymerase sigma factor, sigma-70 family n=1 Tax=Filimonas lacunae TaxID=477680 RepID=A0A173MCV6_9BACT|nr:sigma-70 family RNA polymerase sigma factor [Filimonas lacunae]BAV05385.1 RNA polymerase ECF-type sigma factor [Filimonas lacunae]SIT21564.1 RNA polymerase sigma factor, sigma-70 family [Filimonas lacunae]
MKSDTEEILLWNAYREGDADAFRQLYDIYYPGLINYGHRFTGDAQYVEHAVQDLFVKLWQNRDRIDAAISVKNYLYVSFRRVLLRQLQSAKVFVPLKDGEDDYHFSFTLSPESDLISKERMLQLQQQLHKALQNMNARQREVIYLKYYENLSYDEIADIMGITVKGTYKLMYRAIDTLKEQMGNFMLLVLYLLVSQPLRYRG